MATGNNTSSSDYDNIVRHCLKNGTLWEDPEFPAVQSSVFYHQTPPFAFQWKRPHELVSEPLFVADQFDIDSGKLGDRWFATCLGCLQTAEGLLYRVVPADQTFDEKSDYAGIFRFRIWWCGEWTEVLIDDRLPVVNNRLVFIHAQTMSPFWPALLEKAYAKLHGSYEALKYGTSLDGLSDLTGGIAESILLKSSFTTILTTLNNLLKMTSIVMCKWDKDSDKDAAGGDTTNQSLTVTDVTPTPKRAVKHGESYRIYSLHKVETSLNETIQILRLRCTSNVRDNLSDWATHSSTWNSLDGLEKQRLMASRESDFEFFISLSDWLKTFTHLEIVHLDADTARDEPTLNGKIPWTLRLYHGRWQKGVSAGGCRNNPDTFHMNPQLSISLTEADEVVLALNQHTATDPKVIGFTGYAGNSNETGANDHHQQHGKSYFKSRKSLLNSQYTNSRQVSLRMGLDRGQILVLPTTFEPGEEATFTFRVFSRQPVRIRIVDVVPSVTGPVFARARHPNAGPPILSNTNNNKFKDFSQYEPLFNQVADERRTINAFELQDLLETCLPNDYKSCASLEVCRQVIVAFDSSGLGRITFSNFKDLMCSLKLWHGVFKNHSKEKSGILKADRLRDALNEVGFQLNSAILSVLMMRYIRKDGTLRFGDFVAIILNLSIAFDAFEKRDSMQQGSIRVNRAEWLRLALSC